MTKNNFSAQGGSASGRKTFFIFITAVFLTLGLSISSQSLLAAVWSSPTAPPPGNNTDEPLNKGSSAQIKGGPLWINYDNSPVAPFGLAVYGNVGIGTITPLYNLEVAGIVKGAIMASNRSPVGYEYNILFNAPVRYTVTQSGPSGFNLPSLFDGYLSPSYTAGAPSAGNPIVVNIAGLPGVHTQAGAWVGWTTRYWPPTKFKIEGYDTYGAPTWRTIADYSSTAYAGSDFMVAIPVGGAYTQLKFTFYECPGTGGACGISELFFIHPEAGRPYTGFLPSSMYEGLNGNVGIGTTNPTQRFEIHAPPGSPATSGATQNGMFRLYDSTGGNGLDMGVLAVSPYATWLQAGFKGSDLSVNYPLLLNPNGGNVGIGTTNPTAALQVNPATNVEGVRIITSNYSPFIIRNSTDTADIFRIDENGNMTGGSAGGWSRNSGSGYLYTTALTDKVGIGTTTPSQKLDVVGNININTNGNNALFSTYRGRNSDGNNIWIGGGGQSSLGVIGETWKGSYNTAYGTQALYSNTTGYSNTAYGLRALAYNTTGYYNTANGVSALQSNTTSSFNTANGYQALYSNTTGDGNNTAIGKEALYSNTTGDSNTAIGTEALYSNTIGTQNTAIGLQAGRNGQTMLNSTFLGFGANSSVDGVTNSTAIGYGAQVTASNQVVIGNNAVTQILLKGNVGIGTTNPNAMLHLNSSGSAVVALNVGSTSFRDIAWTTGSNLQLGTWDGTTWSEKFLIQDNGNVGIGTTNPASSLEVAGTGITLGGVTRATWPSGSDAPFFIETIYGDGDLPWRSTANTPQTMRYVYGPFSYAMPGCGSGYTKYYRLYAEFVDNITTGGQGVYARIALDGGTNLDFNLGSTWGGPPSYRNFLSGLFQTANTNHASIQSWINGGAGPFLEIRKLQIWAYCL